MTRFFEWLALLCAALFAGGALYISIVEHPARMAAGVRVALAQFRQMYPRAAPWQASTAALSFGFGLIASLLGAPWAWALGGLVVALVIPWTIVLMLPTNHKLLAPVAPTEDEAPLLLGRWETLHWVRSILGLIGLLILIWRAVNE